MRARQRKSTQPHFPSVPYDQVPAFFTTLCQKKCISSQALRFLILTGARTSEVLNATWNEIDLRRRTWTIHADRMKSNKQHCVPLSNQAISLLRSLPYQKNCPYLFPSPQKKEEETSKPLSGMALLQLLRNMGYTRKGPKPHCVPHGFRGSLRTWLTEVTDCSYEVAEKILAHTIPTPLYDAYQKGDILDKRRYFMQQWGDHCTEEGPEVVGGYGLPTSAHEPAPPRRRTLNASRELLFLVE
ncbi:MAG: site-specific integrase [Candidatus Thiodiazotropha sp.]